MPDQNFENIKQEKERGRNRFAERGTDRESCRRAKIQRTTPPQPHPKKVDPEPERRKETSEKQL